ncbi:hypothetical protein [Sphingomonas sp. LT1P40]|uniref:hypothetical protein n=1 Tax=Alteristakelama amylovorans TaxID=3096166 RepID=UPI002FCC752C
MTLWGLLPMLALLALGQQPPTSPAASPDSGYFPPDLVSPACARGKAKPVSDFSKSWYSQQLKAANEPSLLTPSKSGAVTLRFTWLRSFHAPVFVRVEGWGSSKQRLVATELAGRGGYSPGPLSRRIERKLTRAEVAALSQLWSRADPFTHASPPCISQMDGAQWIIETGGANGYRFIDRQSPDAGPVREVGLALLTLTGWDVGAVY